jgi:hypothetical protein
MAASLPNEPDDLLITDELHHRIAHKADYQREKLAIQDLARQMAASSVPSMNPPEEKNERGRHPAE